MRMWRAAVVLVVVMAGLAWSARPAAAGRVYVVRARDTLFRISRRFGTTPAALAALNHLAAGAFIRPGQHLLVPDGSSAPAGAALSFHPPRRFGPPPAGRAAPAADAAAPGVPARRAPAAAARTSLPSRSSLFGPAAVRAALALVGRPYLWSGMGRGGFDCSGLVAHVFAALGVALPHSSYAQYTRGTAVLRAELFAGDLVFFQTDGPGPSHVGIYVGGSRFVHASSSRGVALASMEDPYFSARFIGARRL
jgi:cell wall-associated NlpC family hydrolase